MCFFGPLGLEVPDLEALHAEIPNKLGRSLQCCSSSKEALCVLKWMEQCLHIDPTVATLNVVISVLNLVLEQSRACCNSTRSEELSLTNRVRNHDRSGKIMALRRRNDQFNNYISRMNSWDLHCLSSFCRLKIASVFNSNLNAALSEWLFLGRVISHSIQGR